MIQIKRKSNLNKKMKRCMFWVKKIGSGIDSMIYGQLSFN
jgi:hypothetical protein